ncbi:biotin--[acetyl-CoA-carboxylase] ligase [Nocardioides speluncae]|uniref:biotin--[acetyl-CoA-carboxylase] ligase n=1 Tax=Nocardioides speluncae TaxID=2670337 RepID=UPI001F0C0B25|nr:biotin--[acetyl-CoA-carboxylase] ligase [Nocardioides speluncae]
MTDALPSRPPLDPARLTATELGSLWSEITVVTEATSTNALVAERARAGAPAGLVIAAEHQTAGRGRLDRTWETPPQAALTFSFLVRPAPLPPGRWPWLPLLAGYAVHQALRGVAPTRLKWPNDVLVDDRKLAGILVELVDTDAGQAAVVGIGLNVSATQDELPVPTATSLALATGTAPDRTELLRGLLATFAHEYAAWAGADGNPDAGLRPAYRQACATLGTDVRVDLPSGEQLTGRATDVDESGRLAVETADGTVSVGAGDVVHVRAADQ